jgi:two-component system chemotaxis response regulator CheB
MRPAVRALVVDDSPSMRAAINHILSADPEIEVVGMAPEPHSARKMIRELNPDVVTLDIEMPGMDGLSFLERIMRLRPMPVVMCSTLTARGAEATIEALRLGAVDCVQKPSGSAADIVQNGARLRETVKSAARSALRRDHGAVEPPQRSLGALPADAPPVLVVQHMPGAFTPGFAARLERECAIRVVEARDAMPLERGTVYIAPGGERHMELAGGTSGRIRLRGGEAVGGHRPSVDVLFRSMAALGQSAIGVILTGMGSDGAAGLLAMRKAGATTLGQSEASCVVYGMPRAAFELGAVERELGLGSIPAAILRACKK